MKETIACVFLSFFLFTNSMLSQPELDSILVRLPANSSAELELYMSQLAALGSPAVLGMSKKLNGNAPGIYDLKERYALAGLAKYLGSSNKNDSTKTIIELAYLQALETGLDIDAEVFLIEQLQFFATDQSIEMLAKKITQLCEPAVQTLSVIGGEQSLNILMKALTESQGYCKSVIVKAIGHYDRPVVVTELSKLSLDNDPEVKMAALKALGNSTSGAALDPLLSYAGKEALVGNDLLLKYARNQATLGRTGELMKIFDLVSISGSPHQKSVATRLIADYLGEVSSKILLKTLTKGSELEVNAVTGALATNKSLPIATYFKPFNKVSVQAQTGLLLAAGVRDYKQALPEARSKLNAPDLILQATAIRTVSKLAAQNSIPDLQNLLVNSNQDIIVNTAIQELSHWITSENIEVISKTLAMVPAKNKVAVINLIADRGMSNLLPEIESYLQSTDPALRKAAFNALPKLVNEASVNDLMALVSIAETQEELSSVRMAFSNKVNQYVHVSEVVLPLLSTFGESSPALLGKILPAIGGPDALEYVKKQSDKAALLEWSKPEVIPDLFKLMDQPNERDTAFHTIMRLLNHRELTIDLRLLYLRKLMPLCQNANEKESVINVLGNTKSLTAFMYAKSLMQDEALRISAAKALVRLALPAAGEALGLYGQEVKQALMQADTILKDQTDGYSDSFLKKYLSILPEQGGFTSMFNGKDLTGWQGLVENPLARDTMFSLDLQTKQIEADAKLVNNWKVENGSITFFGTGYDNLCSVESYRDFEMLVDWKITKNGDSGIYLRGTPQVQIWDTALVDIGAQVGSGGLYNNKVHESKPLVVADNPIGEWNTFRITMIQDKVTVYLNGVLVTDQVILENFWNRELPIFREGPIELQAHGTNLQFRDIYIRELPSAPDLPEMEINAGFKTIFNGINLDGWIGNKTDYVVENGEIVIYPSGSGSGNLFTEKEYDNFVFRFEFKLTPGANNGLGIHAPLEGDVAYKGKEIQILDNTAPIYANLHDYQYHGSVYGLVAAEKNALKPVGEWNTQEVSVNGNQIRVVLNGQRILFDDLTNATRNGTLDGKEHPGLQRLTGHIGFLGHGTEVRFRNIRIKEGNF